MSSDCTFRVSGSVDYIQCKLAVKSRQNFFIFCFFANFLAPLGEWCCLCFSLFLAPVSWKGIHSRRQRPSVCKRVNGGFIGIHTCCIHYRPSIGMIQSIWLLFCNQLSSTGQQTYDVMHACFLFHTCYPGYLCVKQRTIMADGLEWYFVTVCTCWESGFLNVCQYRHGYGAGCNRPLYKNQNFIVTISDGSFHENKLHYIWYIKLKLNKEQDATRTYRVARVG